MSSPTALLLGGEVDLEVVGVVVDVEEAAALVKLADAANGIFRLDRVLYQNVVVFSFFSVCDFLTSM